MLLHGRLRDVENFPKHSSALTGGTTGQYHRPEACEHGARPQCAGAPAQQKGQAGMGRWLPLLASIVGVVLCGPLAGQERLPAPDEPLVAQMPAAGQVYGIEARGGRVGGSLRLTFGEGGEAVRFALTCRDMPKLNHHWRLSEVPDGLEDAGLMLELWGDTGWERGRFRRFYFIRPDVHWYVGEQREQAVQRWADNPPASEHWFALQVSRRQDRIELTVDGRHFSSFPVGGREQFTV
jgi:hypothetical protein